MSGWGKKGTTFAKIEVGVILAPIPSNNLVFSCCLIHLARKTGSQVCCLHQITYYCFSNTSVKLSLIDLVSCFLCCVSIALNDTSHRIL